MAFHFDAKGDSSDEETGGIDIANWKSGAAPVARPRAAPAPVARMVAADPDEDEDIAGPSALSSFATGQNRQTASSSETRSPVLPSFQAINEPVQIDSEESDIDIPSPQLPDDLGDEEDDDLAAAEEEDERLPDGSRPLYVQIERHEVDTRRYKNMTRGRNVVRRVLREWQDEDGGMMYKVIFGDYNDREISFEELLGLKNGNRALDAFQENPPSDDDDEDSNARPTRRGPKSRGKRQQQLKMTSTRPNRKARQQAGFVSTVDAIAGSDEEEDTEDSRPARATRNRKKKQDVNSYEEEPEDDSEESEDELQQNTRIASRGKAAPAGRNLRKRPASTRLTEDGESDDSENVLVSDVFPRQRKNKRARTSAQLDPARQSERSTRHRANMQEREIDDIYRSESEERIVVKPKLTVVRETFKPLPRNHDFRLRHYQYCDTCGQGSSFAPLIDCQGCSLTYHKSCLGHRTNREHLVTKIDEDNFVLQCRRCIGFPRKKDPTAPDHGKCQECRQHGVCCRPFRKRKTPTQEQKERDDNGGVDPSYSVPEDKINNHENVLFRCINCFRGFHFEHLPSRSEVLDIDIDVDAEQRFREYSRDWKCKECAEMPAKVSGLIAWKPLEEDAYDAADGYEGLEEDEKAYLVRWEGMSYFRARWMPGPWVWGVTPVVTRKAFAKRDDAQHPKMRTEDAIPEDYLRTDIVLDIKYTNIVDILTEEVDKARIREVKEALIKYKGLTYEDAVWEAPPGPDDGERWSDFVMAYNDWVAGRYTRQPKPAALKQRLEKVRKGDFFQLEKKEQPENLEGGKLMEYQIQGLNWLYYKWFTQKNAVLADEMGLGKTIQIIGFLATLVQDHSCYPFLVVVPNSTCPNWRREIKRWAPGLRVVAYYGSRESRDLAYRYELYPNGAKDLRCHVVVTSYDAAADENCRKFLRGVPWQGLIVDEGQRLKNDQNLLYSALSALKAPFKILLTGTPLQNNTRELFNLLHFLDDSFNSEELEKEFEDLDQEKITRLHEMIRPFFLRRTKAQVLTFLPPMAQIILPVSMSLVQKKLYRSILAKNPELMKAIFSTESTNVKQGERGSLNNILMQLRKCLCHPFVYNRSIEDRNVDHAASHRNLVDASSKLKLLEILLPKLKERGHRVLIFSQFLEMLDMVEDFLDGMQLRFNRLDGSISALVKQKRIDEFNAPDSQLFAFLLSTRAGGVGINLATADTVIILDPDFNPHQDIQALSRAHRIGQQKKVLCFQLVTRASAEERIMQIGRRKLALDHVLIQEMDAEDAEQNDLVSVLRHGAGELFEDNGDQDILYDNVSVERLLDRSHMEDTSAGGDKSAETQFSFARVWANDQGALEDAPMPEAEESGPDPGVWANILKERERVAAEEAAAKAEAFGRGRRARQSNIDYTGDAPDGTEGLDNITPIKRARKRKEGDESDTDFQADDSDGDFESNGEQVENGELADLERNGTKGETGRKKADIPTFRRAVVPKPLTAEEIQASTNGNSTNGAQQPPSAPLVVCLACRSQHKVGSCPLKIAGVEHCNLCGIAHYGHARVCPHITSETQVRAMLEALKYSNEPEHLVKEATRYLRGLKGSLVQIKKQKEQKEHAAREAYAAEAYQRSLGANAPW